MYGKMKAKDGTVVVFCRTNISMRARHMVITCLLQRLFQDSMKVFLKHRKEEKKAKIIKRKKKAQEKQKKRETQEVGKIED